MHGRLKVRTTEEQAKAKQKERDAKLEQYQMMKDKIFTRRNNGELDEELLKITGNVLFMNSDFLTLWNIRKETFTILEDQKSKEEMQALCSAELQFLENTLLANPKSYGTWSHRSWIVNRMPKPDWKNELMLCNKFLDADERNFHCWDYRRFITKKACISDAAELDFTYQKISSNFSNFSSWHYRSQLLYTLYGDSNEVLRDDILLQELETVQNAFFTDPDDQSAWFYHQWLVGQGCEKLHLCAINYSRRMSQLLLAFSRPVKISNESTSVSVTLDDSPVISEWISPANRSHSFIWTCPLKAINSCSSRQFCITWKKESETETHTCSLLEDAEEMVVSCDQTTDKWDAEVLGALKEQLANCIQLHELVSSNKWAMLAILNLCRTLKVKKSGDYSPLNFIEKLIETDPMRRNYYMDLRSRYLIEDQVMRRISCGGDEDLFVDLQKSQLTCFPRPERLVLITRLDLSYNQLTSLNGFQVLLRLNHLDVQSNRIRCCAGVMGLTSLRWLSLKNNQLSSACKASVFQSLIRLEVLDISDNLLCEDTKTEIVIALAGIQVTT